MNVKYKSPLVTAYNNNPGWKKDEQGNIVLKDGNPVYINAAGQEQTVNGSTIADRNREAQQYRERAEAAEATLKKYDGLDAEIARKAVETVSKLDAKKLIDAGQVDELKNQMKAEFTAQLTEKDNLLKERENKINNLLISDVFKSSEFLNTGIAVPRDFIEAAYRNNFKIEGDKVIAVDKEGKPLASKLNLGEYASPDEALRMFVEARPDKDSIIKADVGAGSGNNGAGGARGQGNIIKRAEFDKMAPAQKGEIASKARTGEVKIVD